MGGRTPFRRSVCNSIAACAYGGVISGQPPLSVVPRGFAFHSLAMRAYALGKKRQFGGTIMRHICGFGFMVMALGLIAFVGCGDDSASPSSCIDDPSVCPTGSRCIVDALGQGACIPNGPTDAPDAFLLTDMNIGSGGSTMGGGAGQGGAAGEGGTGGAGQAGSSGQGGAGSGGNAGQAGSGGSGMGGGTGQGGSGGGGTSDQCRDISILLKPSRAPANTARIMLAVDRSGSVLDWNGWAATLEGIDTTMSLLGEGVQFGLTLFPHPYGGRGPGSECRPARIDQAVGYDTADTIRSLLMDGRPESMQATPTASAIQAAGDHLLASPTGADYILLVTDGAPNCNPFSNDPNYRTRCVCTVPGSCFLYPTTEQGTPYNNMCLDDARTTELIRRYAREGIKTLVLGVTVDTPDVSSIPCPAHRTCYGAQACSCDTGNGCPNGTTGQCVDRLRPTLRAFAEAGGLSDNGDFFEVSNLGDLPAAISQTAASVRPCTFDLEDIANVNDALTVTIDGNEIPNDPNRMNGWYAENGILTLYGNACATIRDGRAHAIAAQCEPR